MKHILSAVAFFATIQASAQQVNPVPDYVFRNQMSVGRNAVTDTAAYFSIGPRYGATKGFMPPIVGDTATFSSGKRNGLLIFSVQKNKFLYWDSVRVQWSDMAGSSGSYITGSGLTGYIPQFTASTTLDTSALYALGSRLGIGTSTFAYNTTNTANIELNNTAGGILGFKRNDSARGYLWHTGDNMELANTVAGSIFFNTNSATRGSISSAGVWRLHGLAGTGDRVVQASSNGTLSASSSVTGLVDTATISTRAWRQKGIDSVVSIIPAAGIGGSGTTNYVPKFTASTTLGNSNVINTSTGDLLLGTTANYYGSTNRRSLEINGTNESILALKRNDAEGAYFFSNANDFRIAQTQNLPMTFFTNNTERLRIFANGRIGVNTTTDAGYQFDVNGSIRAIGLIRSQATVSNTNGYFQLDHPGAQTWKLGVFADNTSTLSIGNDNGGAFSSRYLNITNSGDVGIGTTSPTYKLDVNGTLRSVNGANFATTSGNVGIGTASPQRRLSVNVPFSTTGEITHLLSGQTGTTPLIEITSIVENVSTAATAMGFNTFTANAASSSEKMRLTNNAELLIATTTDAGDYKLQVAGNIYSSGLAAIGNAFINTNSPFVTGANIYTNGQSLALGTQGANLFSFFTNNTERGRINSAGEWIIDASGTDAGDYKLQVVGNARVGTGKLDISTNTAFGLSIARSGTDVVAGQINNSNGILYYGAESSAGGALFTGSSAYAAVIGSGANYPLQFATNNVTRATINTNGELLINTTTDNGDFKLQVNGNALISGSIKTANGGSSTAQPWHLGSVVATNVQLDTANYVEVEINGVYYRLAIVTPL